MTPKKVNIVTLGCSKNLVDSEKMMARIRACGYYVVHDSSADSAEVAIINTCGFISDAREESIDTILDFVKARKSGRLEKLFVTGCLAQRYSEELKKEIPEVDSYFGVHHLEEIISALDADSNTISGDERIITGPGHYAYLKVSEGCDRSCSFCAIPLIRGPHQSRPTGDIIEEAKYLHASGVRELILIAQDLTYYGMDIYGERRISGLVIQLSELKLFDWIRLHYLYPSGFPESLIPVFRDIPEVCRYIDIPVQHISDKILKMMNRIHTRAETINLLKRLRREIPGAALRTTLIVGHPGEGEEEFNELCDFVSEFRFDRLGVFAYSHEENTPADRKYKDEIDESVKNERVARIMEIQQDISGQNNERVAGSTLKVMFDRREGEWMVGRTEFDSPEIDQEVLVPYKQEIKTGTLYDVRITGSGEFDLYGDLTT
ncbi:MAG: 30S ribosomal protein S12 methylthiotransferase RimO [Bacteroidales bacterium]|nr:30S ribosomal protein S12 methylthiotransferase RimO [Bacteroidales bacterium]